MLNKICYTKLKTIDKKKVLIQMFFNIFSRLCEGADLLCRAPSTFTLTLWNTEADLHGNSAASTAIAPSKK